MHKKQTDKQFKRAFQRDFRGTFHGPLAAARDRFMRMAETLAREANAAILNWQATSLAAVLQDRKGGEHLARISREIAADRSKAFGRQGVKVRMEKTTPEQRTRIAQKAVAARWKKARQKAM
jgi:hypothetical protein